jgi:pimeloyl-ACP methyl ester carboxylesterase
MALEPPMPYRMPYGKWFAGLLFAGMLLFLGGCAMVTVGDVTPREYIAQRRGDILSGRHLSGQTVETLGMAGVDASPCEREPLPCINALAAVSPMGEERRQSALAELWLARATGKGFGMVQEGDREQAEAYLEVARHAYAYLFFTERTAPERAFEDRQTQVRDYYNYAVQQFAVALGHRARQNPGAPLAIDLGGTHVAVDLHDLAWANERPREVVAASAMRFDGIRSTYRRDGLGAELVVDLRPDEAADIKDPYRSMPTPSATAFLRFTGDSLDAVLHADNAVLEGHDPFQDATVSVGPTTVPLAGNFTAGYGLWLARSGFASQSLATLFGRERGIREPRIYLMQPYDPDRRVILLLHGLASSPEAWVNVANDILGDERLRRHFQVWQVYYPTNMPIAINNRAIRDAFAKTLAHYDPTGKAVASNHMVIIGHSMGGVIARLMVSSSGDIIVDDVAQGSARRKAYLAKRAKEIDPYLKFTALPNFDEAIFIAAPHRGTVFAGNTLARLVSNLIRLPAAMVTRVGGMLADLAHDDGEAQGKKVPLVPNSVDNLQSEDPFIKAAARLPIGPRVRYHSIIARRNPEGPLEDTDDGLVPYWSSHLDGAASEKVIVSGHSVQETPQAVLEVRRVLNENVDREGGNP